MSAAESYVERALSELSQAAQRLLADAHRDLARVCKENGDLLDEIHALREENARLRLALSEADTMAPGPESER